MLDIAADEDCISREKEPFSNVGKELFLNFRNEPFLTSCIVLSRFDYMGEPSSRFKKKEDLISLADKICASYTSGESEEELNQLILDYKYLKSQLTISQKTPNLV